MKDAPHLSNLELGSSAWQKVKDHAEQRLTIQRAICESPNESEQRRFAAAVRVSELKKLLELAQPAPQPAPQPVE